jgi:hypothetical protein
MRLLEYTSLRIHITFLLHNCRSLVTQPLEPGTLKSDEGWQRGVVLCWLRGFGVG